MRVDKPVRASPLTTPPTTASRASGTSRTGPAQGSISAGFAQAFQSELAARGLAKDWQTKNAKWQPSFFTDPAKHGPGFRYLLTVVNPVVPKGKVDPFASAEGISGYPILSASVVSKDKACVFHEGVALILDAPADCVVATCTTDMHSGNYLEGAWSGAPEAIKGAATLFQRVGVKSPDRFLEDTWGDLYNEVLLMGRSPENARVRTVGLALITAEAPSAEQRAQAEALAQSLGVPCVELRAGAYNPRSEGLLENFVPPPELQDDPSMWGDLFDAD